MGFPIPAIEAFSVSVQVTVATLVLVTAGAAEALGACRGRSLATLRVSLGEPVAEVAAGGISAALSNEAYSLPSCPIKGSVATLGGRLNGSDPEALLLELCRAALLVALEEKKASFSGERVEASRSREMDLSVCLAGLGGILGGSMVP